MPRVIKEYNRLPVENRDSVKLLNELSGREWTQLSKSVVTYGGPIAEKRRKHGAAFPPELARHFLQLLTQTGDVVLDPFLGVGTVADVCTLMNRRCIGFEVNKHFYHLAKQGLDPIDIPPETQFDASAAEKHELHFRSCLEMRECVGEGSVDLTLTSPPYANLLHRVAAHFAGYTYEKNIYRNQGRKLARPYSEDGNTADLGNLGWQEYQAEIGSLMGMLYDVTRPGGFNVWVVRDFRDVEHHVPYLNLHSKIIELATAQKWVLTDIAIWDQTRQRKLVKLGGPKARRFYFNLGYSYLLVFRKNLPGEKFHNW